MASRELHVVTLRALVMILSADMTTMVQHSPMRVLKKVFPLVIREPCVPQQTSSERWYLAKYFPLTPIILYLLKSHLKHRIKAGRGDTTQDAAKEENKEIWEDLAGKVLLDLKSGNIWLVHLQKTVYGANHAENLEQANIRQENT